MGTPMPNLEKSQSTRLAEIAEILENKNLSEANKHTTMNSLSAIERELESIIDSGDGSDEALLLYAHVARGLGKWESALLRYLPIVDTADSRVSASAYLGMALAHRKLGNLQSADESLSRAESAGAATRSLKRHRRKLVQSKKGIVLESLAQSGWRDLNAGAYDTAKALLVASLRVRGLSHMVVVNAAPAFAALARYLEKQPVPAPDAVEVDTERPIILTSGSGYSGTGAIHAYLMQVKGLSTPFGSRELSALKAMHGIDYLLRTAGTKKHNMAVKEFVVSCIFGVPRFKKYGAADRHVAIAQSLLHGMEQDAVAVASLSSLTIQFLHDLQTVNVKAASKRFINAALRISESGPILLNNCIHHRLIHLAGLLENATTIAVFRDPRDQYVARRMESARAPLECNEFISRRLRDEKAIATYEGDSTHVPIEKVQFEEFVLHEDVRFSLLSRLRIPRTDLQEELGLFIASQSAQNVGIHTKWPHQDEVKKIERELRAYLIPLVG